MVDIVKQDMSLLWASSGDVVAPSEDKITTGWGVEVVPRQWWNWMQNRVDNNVAYILQKTFAEWDEDTEYIANKSYVQHMGTVYKCIQTNTGSSPQSSPLVWVKSFIESTVALESIKGLTPAADTLGYFTGASSSASTPLTPFARSILDDPNASAVRSTLGLGTLAVQNANSVAIAGGTITGITDLAVADGGTGASTAEAARINLGTNDAANLTAGIVPDARLSGTYTGVNITGNAATATRLETSRNINGVAFNGTSNITVFDNTKLPLTGGLVSGTIISSAAITVLFQAPDATTRGTIYHSNEGFGFQTSLGDWAVRVRAGNVGVDIGGVLTANGSGLTNIPQTGVVGLQTTFDTKVDKVSGKALSTNDFDNAYKTKVDGIEAGAQVNPGLVSQSAAEAGTSTTIFGWSPLRQRQAVVGWWTASEAKVKLDSIPAIPPNDGKSYYIKDGVWVEAQTEGTGSPLLSIEWFAGLRSALATERPGCVPLDGQTISRTTFPTAWSKISAGNLYPMAASDVAWTGSVSERRKFSPGDGSTTFRVMDLNGATTGKAYFLRGSSSDSFSLKEDQIQNITGEIGQFYGAGNGSPTEAFGDSTYTANPFGGAQYGGVKTVKFDASKVARTGTETSPAHASGVWIIRVSNAAGPVGTVDVQALASEVAALKSNTGALIRETYYRTTGPMSHTFATNTATYEVEGWSAGAGSGVGGGDGGSTAFGSISITGAKWRAPAEGKGGVPGIATGGLINLNGAVAGSTDTSGWASTGAAAPRGGTGGSAVVVAAGNDTTPFANGQQPGGGAGALTAGFTYGSSGGYSFDRKAVAAGSTITGVVGAGGVAGTYGGKGGDGMIIIREYASSGPRLDTIATILDQTKPVIMAGQIGSALYSTGLAAPFKIPYEDFKVTSPDITYDSANRRFYINKSGVYRVMCSVHGSGSVNRLLIGLNTDTPTTVLNEDNVHGTGNVTLRAEATIQITAGQYVVFYFADGTFYNIATNRFGGFSIERVG